jgi:hypothetical protein
MTKSTPQIGECVFVRSYGQPNERTRVVNRIGQYVLLENGLRFHVNDDRVGPQAWHLVEPGAAICMEGG